MKRKTRLVLANTVIATTSLAGGIAITQALTSNVGGFASLLAGTSGTTATAGADQTVTGDAVDYRYGTIQLEVVRSGGKISDVNLIQAGANGGREQAFPTLVEQAISAQGSSFSNLSGATFTVTAFKQALDSAIAKLS